MHLSVPISENPWLNYLVAALPRCDTQSSLCPKGFKRFHFLNNYYKIKKGENHD